MISDRHARRTAALVSNGRAGMSSRSACNNGPFLHTQRARAGIGYVKIAQPCSFGNAGFAQRGSRLSARSNEVFARTLLPRAVLERT